jgi:isopentenyl diphosphate isomerase/L-lactate dehydrogenase-like FMN-dependent dehydrogenase
MREMTHLKIVLKGIMHPKDAEIAVNYCDAIWVSNHGGRQLDGVESTINVLPSIKAAVGNKVPIFVDGGVRTGNDVFKCLALGADYVFVARPVAYSLIFGYEGVNKLVNILEDELKRCMILVGCRKLTDIKAGSIVPEPHL